MKYAIEPMDDVIHCALVNPVLKEHVVQHKTTGNNVHVCLHFKGMDLSTALNVRK